MMTQNTPPVLAPDYYRHNFDLLLRSVRQQYHDLLSHSEHWWLNTYLRLTPDAKQLYIRMLSRKGRYFRVSKLSYPEIRHRESAIEELLSNTFVTCNEASWPVDEILDVFTKPELLKIFSNERYPAVYTSARPVKQARKADLITAILATSPDISVFNESIVHVEHQAHLTTFLLLFFGNQYQDLSQFVLTDLGLHLFENYQIDETTRLFQQRQHILEWLSLEALAAEYEQLSLSKDAQTVRQFVRRLPGPCAWPPLERRRQRLFNRIARDLERLGEYDLALYLFNHSALPPSRERRVRILERLQRHPTALAISQQMLSTPFNEEEAEVGQRLAYKLSRTLNLPVTQATKDNFTLETLTLAVSGERVELAVANHYRQAGWRVYYTENALICGLFGLAFWDIIFAPVAGAFLNPFQRAPRDMYHSEFSERRRDMLTARLNAIRTESWHNWLAVFQQKQGITNDWVNWAILTPALVEETVSCLNGEQLYAMLSRLLFDPRHNRSGQPDLVMFRNGHIQWVEVKGPGDTLQANQKRWLRLFQQLGLEARVNHVVWQM
ncbi:VRR-NUC domain-containing protein [Photobacterium halotolerans]|uniref:VRR-NUC domain-containing protein n=1 Tax=Photobacterium halotolerans TaxID=265726 RepID=UPI001372F72F|nr:VRR-NUC domain-containing protein [Photobacterium halotolerans]NAX49277.1 VRR-NUC domain-containing protein [Photobacterium halotolerans]